MAYVISDECVACGTCAGECPVEAISEGDIYHIDPDTCIECGSCSYVCPAHRPLVENNRAGKKYLKKYKADHAEGGKK